nr:unnamed protein product [Callosobruchus analis]
MEPLPNKEMVLVIIDYYSRYQEIQFLKTTTSSIAHANNKNYQKEIQKFILMYNVTIHGTTGKSPSQLLFGRNIRDKIPSIDDLENTGIDEEARDNDMRNK